MRESFMTPALLRRIRLLAIVIGACSAYAVQVSAQARRYSVDQVSKSLRDGSTPARVTIVVGDGCVAASELTAEDEARLRQVGVTNALIKVIRSSLCPTPPADAERPRGKRGARRATPLDVGFGDGQLRRIDAGSFEMGSDAAGDDERPMYTAEITRASELQ
jgi:hypothetical protein